LNSIKGIKGLPLGMMLSGYLSNIFLSRLDYKYDKYIRYADDILVFSNTKKELLKIKDEIARFLKAKGLRLNEQKTQISSHKSKLDYLGYCMTKESVLPRENVLKNFFKKIEGLNNPSLNAYKPWFFFEELC
jgi:retron-type reverse transcriptase